MSHTVATQFTRAHGKLLTAVSVAPRDIGRRIAAARTRKGWTQLQFALHANVSPSSVARWEAGGLPPVRELMRIAELLDVEPETLVEPDEPTEQTNAQRLTAIEERLDDIAEALRNVHAMLEQLPPGEEEHRRAGGAHRPGSRGARVA